MNKGDVALRINTTIYCVDFYFLKQYIVYKSFSATAPSITCDLKLETCN